MNNEKRHCAVPKSGNPILSAMDGVLAFLRKENLFGLITVAGRCPEAGMRFEVSPKDGEGYVSLLRLTNGLEVWESDQLRHKPLKASMKNAHTYFGFTLMIEGHVIIEVPEAGQTERINAGEIAFRRGSAAKITQTFPSGTRLRGLSMDIPSEMYEAWANEVPDRLNRGISALLRDTQSDFFRVFPANEAIVELADKMLKIDTETSFGKIEYEAFALNLLARLIDPSTPPVAHISRSQMRLSNIHTSIDQAVEILRNEWTVPPTNVELARRVGLNKRTLQDEFRRRTGLTPGQYVRRQRMEKARKLIDSERLGVQETALHVGYSNPSHFSAAFKKFFGHLPSSRRHRN